MATGVIIQKLDELLAPHLSSHENISEYHTKPHTAAGENFGSYMISVDVTITDKETGKQRTLHLVNKMIPQDPVLVTMFNTKVTYIKELDFYLKAVPSMLKLQQDNGVPEKDWITNIVPKCYGGRLGFGNQVDSDAAILLENLRPRGFGLKDKRDGLNLIYARFVMEKLGYLHALPIAVRIKRPDEYEKCILTAAKHFEMNEDDPNKDQESERYNSMFAAIVKGFPINRELINKTLAITTKMGMNYYAEIKEPFVTIMHNDLWVNNILFASSSKEGDDDSPAGIAFVDYQTTVLNSPLCDVVFFLFTSVEPSIRRNHFDELIDVYHESFGRCLRQVDCDSSAFSKQAFYAEMDRVAQAKLADICSRLRVILAGKEILHEENWWFRVDVGGEKYVEWASGVISDFNEKGWLRYE